MVTLDDCATFVGCGGSALCGAYFGYQYFGWPGTIGGLVLGPVAYVVAVMVPLGTYELLRREWPPVCADGKCKGGFWHKPGTYELVVVFDIADHRAHVLHRCRCGHPYEHVGRCFMERLPDGTLRPYMIYRPYRGWFPDTEPGPAPEAPQARDHLDHT